MLHIVLCLDSNSHRYDIVLYGIFPIKQCYTFAIVRICSEAITICNQTVSDNFVQRIVLAL